jgi:hypothetical protein
LQSSVNNLLRASLATVPNVVGADEYHGSMVCESGVDSMSGHTSKKKVNPMVTMMMMYLVIKVFSLGLPI